MSNKVLLIPKAHKPAVIRFMCNELGSCRVYWDNHVSENDAVFKVVGSPAAVQRVQDFVTGYISGKTENTTCQP